MAWRRFTEGKVGALTAQQYTEVQDAVQALVSRLGSKAVPGLPGPQPMLVRITQRLRQSTAGSGSVSGSARVPGAVYAFRQLHVRVTTQGIEVAARPYGITSDVQGGMEDAERAVAIDLTPDSNIPANTVVSVYPLAVDMGEDGNQVPQAQAIYAIMNAPAQDAALSVYTILSSSGDGLYIGRTSASSAEVTIENLYETSDYYGALLGPQNPCALLTPRPLGAGDRVLGMRIGQRVITCAPTAWSVQCLNCGTNPGGALIETANATNNESAVASMMLKGI
jgi:hypothetical protein